MAYRIDRTDKADEQLHDIVMYRVELTGDVDSGLELLNLIEKEINRLSDFSEMGAPPRYAALRARGFRVLIIEKYLVFYKVNHANEQVIVHAIIDGRRDYLNLI